MTTTTFPTRPHRQPWRLGGRTRKAVLVTHVIATGIWLGLDVAMAVLAFTAMSTYDRQTEAAALQALRLVTVWPMLAAGLLALASGVLLGLGSKYGLVRYWWVLVKLVLNVVLCTLVLLALRGGVDSAAAAGRAMAAGVTAVWNTGDMVFPSIVSPAALVFAFLLSVFKPWGRVRRRAEGKQQRDRTPATALPTAAGDTVAG